MRKYLAIILNKLAFGRKIFAALQRLKTQGNTDILMKE